MNNALGGRVEKVHGRDETSVVHHYAKREVTLTGSELTIARKWRFIF